MIPAARAIILVSPGPFPRARRSFFGAVGLCSYAPHNRVAGSADSLQRRVCSIAYVSPRNGLSKPFSISPGARQDCFFSHHQTSDARVRSSLSAEALRQLSSANQLVLAKRFGPLQCNAARLTPAVTHQRPVCRVAPLRAGRGFQSGFVTHCSRELPTSAFPFVRARRYGVVSLLNSASARDLFTHRQACKTLSPTPWTLGGATSFAKLLAKRIPKPVFSLPTASHHSCGAGPRPSLPPKEKCSAPPPQHASERRRTTCKN